MSLFIKGFGHAVKAFAIFMRAPKIRV